MIVLIFPRFLVTTGHQTPGDQRRGARLSACRGRQLCGAGEDQGTPDGDPADGTVEGRWFHGKSWKSWVFHVFFHVFPMESHGNHGFFMVFSMSFQWKVMEIMGFSWFFPCLSNGKSWKSWVFHGFSNGKSVGHLENQCVNIYILYHGLFHGKSGKSCPSRH